jgi:hypothetical protein
MIAVMEEPPDLMDEAGVEKVIVEAKRIDEVLRTDANVRLQSVIIDTLISSFGISNWNDAGETSKANKIMKQIIKETGAVVIGLHHHGKDTTRGAAGSHALTLGPDSILSVYRKANQDGVVSGRHFSFTKNRFGETGRRFPFELQTLPPDEREEEGDGQAFVVPLLGDTSGLGDSKSKKPKPSASHGEDSFESAFEAVLKDEGIERKHADEGAVRAVSLLSVKKRFMQVYKPKGSGDSVDAKRKAWQRALDKCGDLIHRDEWDDKEWLYINVEVPDSES